MKSTKTTMRNLPCTLTDEEIQDMGKDLSKKLIEHAVLEQEKKDVVAKFNHQLKEMMTVITEYSQIIDEGKENRDIQCEVEYNNPLHGKKRLRRMDTLDYWVEAMTEDEIRDLANPQIDFGDTVTLSYGGQSVTTTTKAMAEMANDIKRKNSEPWEEE